MQAHDPSSFGQWLRRSRKALDLTQVELASRAGCAKGTIRKLESGELRPSKQLAEILAQQLGVPAAERAAFVRFARESAGGAGPELPAAGPAQWHEPLQPRNNLPLPLTSFIGRAEERAAVKRMFAGSRLLTLTGAGGIGKTRLSLEVAGEVCQANAGNRPPTGGVWLVEFAQLFDPALVPQTVAAVLGLREQAGRALLQTLADTLRAQELLLVLDNCEHLLEPIANLAAALLRACPGVQILATSREPLGVPGEACFAVPPLSMPRVPMLSSTPELQPEAVQLFIARARAVQPAFSLDGGRAPLVASLCMQLDGIPLAIELAAARLRSLPLEQIVAHLDDRFALLTAGPRTVPPRQQTLRAAIDWSYDLLPAGARVLFRRLSVFAGGFTLEAAEDVTKDEGGRMKDEPIPPSSFRLHPSSFTLHPSEVLDQLARLVDHSLVKLDTQNRPQRYRMLETIRQYARDRLLESDEAERVRGRHLAYFLQLAHSAEPQLRGPAQVDWWTRLAEEHDNLRAALSWCQEQDAHAAAGLDLAASLARFWETRDYLSEGRELLAAALAHPGARALAGAGLLAWKQGDYAACRALHQESLAIFRALGDQRGMAAALLGLGDAASGLGEYQSAPGLFAESLALWRAVGEEWSSAVALMDLGWSLMRLGDAEQAAARLAEALRYFRLVGDRSRTALVLSGLGEAAVRQGHYERARALLDESLALRRELGQGSGVAISLGSLGWLSLCEGDLALANACLIESLRIRQELGQKGGMAWCLEKLAQSAIAASDAERAAQIASAAAALRAATGSTIDPVDRPEYERGLARVRAMLGPGRFAACWAAGQALSLEQAVAYALAVAG